MSETKDGGPAFPIPPLVIGEKMWDDRASDGMSKRELIAMHALAGMATSAGFQGLPWDKCAAEAAAAADALIAALSDKGK